MQAQQLRYRPTDMRRKLQATKYINIPETDSGGETLTRTPIYPNKDSVGLSKMLLILYSKFCAATGQEHDLCQNVLHGRDKDRGTNQEGSEGTANFCPCKPQSRHKHHQHSSWHQKLSITDRYYFYQGEFQHPAGHRH